MAFQQSELQEEQSQIKIIVVGDSQVGKSSLITGFVDKKFNPSNVSTVGVDFRIVQNQKLNNGNIYQISIWDTAGQEQFKSIVKISCKGADGAIICFDLSDENSLSTISEWIKYVKENCPESVQIVVAGTKSDLKDSCCDREELKRIMEEFKIKKWFITTSKLQKGIDELFNYIFNEASKKKEEDKSFRVIEVDRTQSRITINNKSQKSSCMKSTKQNKEDEKSGCC